MIYRHLFDPPHRPNNTIEINTNWQKQKKNKKTKQTLVRGGIVNETSFNANGPFALYFIQTPLNSSFPAKFK